MCQSFANVLTVPEWTSPPLFVCLAFSEIYPEPRPCPFSLLFSAMQETSKIGQSYSVIFSPDKECHTMQKHFASSSMHYNPCIFSACVYLKVHFFFSSELTNTKLNHFFHSVDTGNLLPVYPENNAVSRLLLLNFVLHLGWKTTGSV